MESIKKVFEHVKSKTGKEEIMETDLEHVNEAISSFSNFKQQEQLKQIFEDALKDGNVLKIQNIDFKTIENNKRLLLV